MAILKSVTDVVSLMLSVSELQIFAAWYQMRSNPYSLQVHILSEN